MKNIIHKNVVLVLNRNWQAIAITTPAQAFSQMATDAATGLDIQSTDWMVPVKWNEWKELEVREDDLSIGITDGQVRAPTVIVLCRYSKVPIHRPKLNAKNLWLRDAGICQYSGKKLEPGEGNIDHVIPVSRGGANSWENCVLSCRTVNQKKADKTPQEVGLKLLRRPVQPRSVPITSTLKNIHDLSEWDHFLVS